MNPPAPEYCTPAEAAAFLATTPGHLATLRWRGTGGPPFTKIGGSVRYSYADLRTWMEANRVSQGEDSPARPYTTARSHP